MKLTSPEYDVLQIMEQLPIEGQHKVAEWAKIIAEIYTPLDDRHSAVSVNIANALDSMKAPLEEKAIEETEEIALLTDYRKLDRAGRDVVQEALETALNPVSAIEID